MLARETVFVIGAGASFELGMPLGTVLREQIADLVDVRYEGFRPISGDEQINGYLREIAKERGYPTINDLLHKCWLMRDALPGAISIDNLIDAHRNDSEFAEIGKMAIAKAILKAENRSKLYLDEMRGDRFSLRQVDGTYLIPLFQLLTEGVSREDAPKVFSNTSFIVYNYDRCLEFFLPKALSQYYGIEIGFASEIVDAATIIQPYGRVGEFGRGKSLASAAFGAERTNIRKIAEGIRTFSEGLAEEDLANAIRDLVEQADQIIFLGFAFHPMNMEVLQPKSHSFADKVYATTLGLSDAAVRSINGSILQALRKRAPDDILPPPDFGETLSEMNLEARSAAEFLQAHFRGIAS